MIIYCTDLDRTLVYSNKFLKLNKLNVFSEEYVKVSDEETYPVFMTKFSYNKLIEFYKSSEVLIIPATTRSTAEFETLSIFKNSKYAIVCNGAKILIDGKEDEGWKSKIDNVISGYKYHWKNLINKIDNQPFILNKMKLVEDYFIFGKHNNEKECRRYLEDNIDLDLFFWTIQGSKFYILPKFIRKENALKYLIDKLKISQVIVSGDGDIDIGLFSCATLPSYIVINESSKQSLNLNKFELKSSDILRVVKNKGIESSNEILININEILKKGGK